MLGVARCLALSLCQQLLSIILLTYHGACRRSACVRRRRSSRQEYRPPQQEAQQKRPKEEVEAAVARGQKVTPTQQERRLPAPTAEREPHLLQRPPQTRRRPSRDIAKSQR